MSYDVNLYFRNTETGKLLHPYGDNFSYTSEKSDIQEKQYKRNLKIGTMLQKEFPEFFFIQHDESNSEVQLEVKNYEKIGVTPDFDWDLLTLYIHFSELEISDEEHAQYISEIVWKVSWEEDCIIDDPQLWLFWIPSRLFLKVKDEFSPEEIYEYKAQSDYLNRIYSPEKENTEKSMPFWRNSVFLKRAFIVLMIIWLSAKFIQSYMRIEKLEEVQVQKIQNQHSVNRLKDDNSTFKESIKIYMEPWYRIYRPEVGDSYDGLSWVIIDKNTNEVLLQRNARNELSYTYYRNYPWTSYRVYLEAFINGKYQRISNIIEYSVQ